ncbi:MAG: PAS domain-containing protein [Acidimicrobiales bacterium]
MNTSSGRPWASNRPNGRTRTFGADEVIVTKTDLQGRITYANDVFLRVAAYEEHEVMGKPHSIIRHPDMPRCVFGLLWREIQAGNEIFAYVNNLAKDGVSYWVFAHVTPTWRDGRIIGYHSNRRVPDPAAVRAVEPIYRQLLAEEQRHHHPVEAMEASTAMLGEVLAGAGVTYDQFVWSLAGASA